MVAARPISTTANLLIRGIVTIIIVQAVVIVAHDPQIVVNHTAVVNAELACNDNGKKVKLVEEEVLDERRRRWEFLFLVALCTSRRRYHRNNGMAVVVVGIVSFVICK